MSLFSDKTRKIITVGVVATAAIGIAYYFFTESKSRPSYGNQRTFAIIKPDAYAKADEIQACIVRNGFRIIQSRTLRLSLQQASLFYVEHDGKPFYESLMTYMTSGNVLVLMLEKENAIASWRQLMGPTDSVKATKTDPQSIRAKFGTDIEKNAVHGSDSVSSAKRELAFFFDD